MSIDDDTIIRRPMKCCPECAQLYSPDSMFCPFDGAKLDETVWTAPTDPTIDPLLGTTVDGRYKIQRVLGEGGSGTVYEVRHETLSRLFAMKVLRADVARDSTLAARFMQEARATASLKHPHIVSITDFGHLPNGTPYFVMELLVGHTLAHVCKVGGQLPAARAVRIIRQVADALGAAHDAGIVHRDVKPENLFLVGRIDGEGQEGDDVRVVDFGAAKIAGAGRMTKTGIVFGTPHYMSPEQASGQPVDHRADIYALGVIMYEIFSGHLPFQADTFMGVLTQHMFVEPARFAAEMAKDGAVLPVFSALEEVTLRAMAKRPELRFQSMQAVADEIDRSLVVGADGTLSLAGNWTPPAPRRSLRPGPSPSAGPAGLANVLEAPDRSEMQHTSVDVSVVPRAFWPRGAAVLGLSVAAAALLATWVFSSRVPAASATEVPPLPAAAARKAVAPAIPPPSPLASVHVTTTPPFAEIWQGDRRVGTSPMDLAVVSGAPASQYVVRASGFADRPLVLDSTAPSSIEIALQRNAVTAPASPKPVKRRVPRSASGGELIDPFGGP